MPMRFFLACIIALCSLPAGAQDFPRQFAGHWEGKLAWFQPGQAEPRLVNMQLTILPADSAGQYSWKIVYGEGSRDSRPYILKPVDTAKGHWAIDEKNGIVLDQYWLGNRLTSGFTVGKTTIINSYSLEGDSLVAEFYSLSSEPSSTSGGTADDIPVVISYASKGYQRAVLSRRK